MTTMIMAMGIMTTMKLLNDDDNGDDETNDYDNGIDETNDDENGNLVTHQRGALLTAASLPLLGK